MYSKSFKKFLKSKQLSEGLIKLPHDLLKKVMIDAKSIMCSYILFNNDIEHGDKMLEQWSVLKTIENFSIENNLNLTEILNDKKTFERDGKVTFFYENILKNNFAINLKRDFLTIIYRCGPLDIPDASGYFNAFKNNIEINLKKLMPNCSVNILKGLDVNIYVESVISALNHELTHFVQYSSFHHPDQISSREKSQKNTTNDNDKYYLQTVEFDPQIKTVIGNIKQYKLLFPDFNRSDLEYLVGLSDKKTSKDINRSLFMTTLKRRAPQKYKKAIKYIMSNL